MNGSSYPQQPTIAALPPQEGVERTEEEEKKDGNIPDTSNDAALAASLAADLNGSSTNTTNNMNNNNVSPNNNNYRVATASAPWQYDDLHSQCYECGRDFHPLLNRKHHCRLCGNIFCHHPCTDQKALIPPSRIVLHPVDGKKAKPRAVSNETISFTPDEDPDRMLTYTTSSSGGSQAAAATAQAIGLVETSSSITTTTEQQQQLLYGKGLEERFQLAREPLRVCRPCHTQLQPLQEELRRHNSHCMRFNHIDATDPRRLFNSPLAFSLGHEIRKAAYTLNNLLPQPKRGGAVLEYNNNSPYGDNNYPTVHSEVQQCKEQCSSVSPNLGDLDGVRIPAVLLEKAKGVAVLTVVKGGFGLAGVEFGTGLVVARLAEGRWSAPSAIGTAGLSWGALLGAQVSDHVFLLMTDAAVNLLFSDHASVQLGADVGVAVGPLGRALEGDWGLDGRHAPASIYTYSCSKGLYAGVSLDGKIVTTRHDLNEKFYGTRVTGSQILAGAVPTPPAAQPLFEALQRCHVYASMNSSARPRAVDQESAALRNEYGEVVPPPPLRDQASVGNMSDITDF